MDHGHLLDEQGLLGSRSRDRQAGLDRWLEGRAGATSRGVMYMIFSTLKTLGIGIDEVSVAIQGYGKVGGFAAQLLHDAGCRVVAVSDVEGGLYREKGLDPEAINRHKREAGHGRGLSRGRPDHQRGAARGRVRRAGPGRDRGRHHRQERRQDQGQHHRARPPTARSRSRPTRSSTTEASSSSRTSWPTRVA